MSKRVRKTTMEDLTPEIILEILSRLPIKSIFVSKCVCPTWRNLVSEPRFASMHLIQASRNRNQNPALILQTYHSGLYAIPDCDNCDEMISLKNLPFKSWLPKFNVMGSCNGFLCFADNTCQYRSIFVCNPVTGEYVKLPDDDTLGKINSAFCGFGFDHDKNEYKVAKMRIVGDDGKLEIEVHTLGTDSWRSIGNPPKMIGGKRESSGVLAAENLHWLGLRNPYLVDSIISFSLKDEKIRVIPLPRPLVGKNLSRIHLGSFRGRLMVVDDSFRKRVEIWVMKDYGLVESWIKEHVIKRPVRRDSVGRVIRILGVQKDDRVIMECTRRELFSYDPQSKTLNDLSIRRLQTLFEAFLHVPSLLSLKDAFVPEQR